MPRTILLSLLLTTLAHAAPQYALTPLDTLRSDLTPHTTLVSLGYPDALALCSAGQPVTYVTPDGMMSSGPAVASPAQVWFDLAEPVIALHLEDRLVIWNWVREREEGSYPLVGAVIRDLELKMPLVAWITDAGEGRIQDVPADFSQRIGTERGARLHALAVHPHSSIIAASDAEGRIVEYDMRDRTRRLFQPSELKFRLETEIGRRKSYEGPIALENEPETGRFIATNDEGMRLFQWGFTLTDSWEELPFERAPRGSRGGTPVDGGYLVVNMVPPTFFRDGVEHRVHTDVTARSLCPGWRPDEKIAVTHDGVLVRLGWGRLAEDREQKVATVVEGVATVDLLGNRQVVDSGIRYNQAEQGSWGLSMVKVLDMRTEEGAVTVLVGNVGSSPAEDVRVLFRAADETERGIQTWRRLRTIAPGEDIEVTYAADAEAQAQELVVWELGSGVTDVVRWER